MYLSGGENGKGNFFPNYQQDDNSSATGVNSVGTTLSLMPPINAVVANEGQKLQQQQAQQQQQQQQQQHVGGNMSSLNNISIPPPLQQSCVPAVIPPTCHQAAYYNSSHMSQLSQMYRTLSPPQNITQFTLPVNFSQCPGYFLNTIVPQIRSPGFVSSINHNIMLQTSNLNNIKPPFLFSLPPPAIQPFSPYYGTNRSLDSSSNVSKKRPHALPVIHPITHKNILEPDNDSKYQSTDSLNTLVTVDEKSSTDEVNTGPILENSEKENTNKNFQDIVQDSYTDYNEQEDSETFKPYSELSTQEVGYEFENSSFIAPTNNFVVEENLNENKSEENDFLKSDLTTKENEELPQPIQYHQSKQHESFRKSFSRWDNNERKQFNNDEGATRRKSYMNKKKKKNFSNGKPNKRNENRNHQGNEGHRNYKNEANLIKIENISNLKMDNNCSTDNTNIDNKDDSTLIATTMEFTQSSKKCKYENNWKHFIKKETKSSLANNEKQTLQEQPLSFKPKDVINDKENDSSNLKPPPINPKIQECISLVKYRKNQWSPLNTKGKKSYDIEQIKIIKKLMSETNTIKINSNASCVVRSFQDKHMQKFSSKANNNNNNKYGNNNSKHGNHGDSNDWQNNNNNPNAIVRHNNPLNMHNKQQQQQNKAKINQKSNKGNDIIVINLDLNRDVKLNETENAWKPSHLQMEAKNVLISGGVSESGDHYENDELLRKVRGILNKLTPEKFDLLVEQIMQLPINTVEKINGVMMLVFEKAIDEPNFSTSYARLCQKLADKNAQCENNKNAASVAASTVVASAISNSVKKNLPPSFKIALLDKTEREFNMNIIDLQSKKLKLKPIVDQINSCADLQKKSELKAILEDEEFKFRRRSCGTVKFIGELFKMSMLTGRIIMRCIKDLLDAKSEDKLECLCKLLRTVGEKYEKTYNKETGTNFNLNDTLQKMQNIVDKKEEGSSQLSNRVRFMLQDVIDLQKNAWNLSHSKANSGKVQILQRDNQKSMVNNTNINAINSNSGSSSSKNYEKQNKNVQVNRKNNDSDKKNENCIKSLSNQQYRSNVPKHAQHVDASKLNSVFNVDKTMKLGNSSQFMWRCEYNNNKNNSTSNEGLNGSKEQNNNMNNKQHRQRNQYQQQQQTQRKTSPSKSICNNTSTFPIEKTQLSKLNNKKQIDLKKPDLDKDNDDELSISSLDLNDDDSKMEYSRRIVNDLCETYIEESQEACLQIWNEIPKKLHKYIFLHIFTDFLHLGKTKNKQRKSISNLVKYLLNNNKVSLEDLYFGFNEFYLIANDVLIDVPDAWKYIFEFIGLFLYDDLIQMDKIWNKKIFFNDRMNTKFLRAFVIYLKDEYEIKYENVIMKILKQSKMHLKDFFDNDNEMEKFAFDNKLMFLLNKNHDIDNNDEKNTKKNNNINEEDSNDLQEFFGKLLELLNSNNSTTDQVINLLSEIDFNNKIKECKYNEYLKKFFLIICKCAIDVSVQSSSLKNCILHFNKNKFNKKCLPLLRRYLDSKENYELEFLNTTKTYITSNYGYNNSIAYDVLCQIFYEMWDKDVIPQETFVKWYLNLQKGQPNDETTKLSSTVSSSKTSDSWKNEKVLNYLKKLYQDIFNIEF